MQKILYKHVVHNMKLKILLLTLCLSGLHSYSQKLTCSDFKTGKFYIPTNEELKKYTITSNDSIKNYSIQRDENIKRYVVIRKKNTQTEWENGIGNGKAIHEIIEWIDDCTYRLKFDSSKGEMNEKVKWVNENNGIVVTKTKIEGKCMFYKATMTSKNGEKISQNGIICKE